MILRHALRQAVAFAVLGLVMFATGASQLVYAQEDPAVLERRVKAAYLYKFVSYIEWPAGAFADAATPVRIVVLGDEELANELVQITTGRGVEGRPVSIRRTRDAEAAADAHIVFVGRGEFARLRDIVRNLRGRPVMIVTDSPGAMAQGSVINFMLIDRHVKFEIALDEAERRNLKVSSRLLAVAYNVRKGQP